MPVLQRLDWIARQVGFGRAIHCSLGHAADASKFKVKITLAAATDGPSPVIVSECVLSMLNHIRTMLTSHPCCDRGHKHSDGKSVISIWISSPVLGATKMNPSAPVFVPTNVTPSGSASLTGVPSTPPGPIGTTVIPSAIPSTSEDMPSIHKMGYPVTLPWLFPATADYAADQFLSELRDLIPGADAILASIWSDLFMPTPFLLDDMRNEDEECPESENSSQFTPDPVVSPDPMHVDDMIPLDAAALARGLYIMA